MPLTPPLKYHGGKSYLASRLVAMLPTHRTYCEPFAGGLATLLAKPPAGAEVINDLDGRLTDFWRALSEPRLFAKFYRAVQAVPFSEPAWRAARAGLENPIGTDDDALVYRAACFFILCRQSRAGQLRDFATLTRSRLRRGMNEQVSAWLTCVAGLPAVHDRLRRVLVLHRPALDVIRQLDDAGTLFYCDPPYLHATRAVPDAYRHEMTEADHAALLEVLLKAKGMVMLSSYPSALYDAALAGWYQQTFDLPNHAAGGTAKRRMAETVWSNFPPANVGRALGGVEARDAAIDPPPAWGGNA